jgi:LysM repeat protein
MKSRPLIVFVIVALLVTAVIPMSTVYASECTWHVVKKGDNLFRISQRYGVSISSIMRANGIGNASVIYRGQTLCIPKEGGAKPSPKPISSTCTVTHVVKRGEWLRVIAARYGTTVTAIVRLNGIKNPNRIYVGQRLKIPVKCPQPGPKPPASKPWRGEYWANRDQAGKPKFVRNVAEINFNWGHGGPQGLQSDNFSVRWTRTQKFKGGRYLFHVRTKDGVRLLVDGQLLIDEWKDTDYPMEFTVERDLTAGNHNLKLDYFNHNGPAQVKLRIERIGGPTPDGPGPWKAEYWNNIRLEGSPAWSTKVEAIDFDWGWGSPRPGISADFFSARYDGKFHFADGRYRFYTTVDDGVRIWLGKTLILDEWHVTSPVTYVTDVDIPEGDHKIRVEYFERTGVAKIKVVWAKR